MLEARNLDVVRGTRRVLAGTDFAARPGELIGVLGPNGAGKSTLLKALAGLLPAAGGAVLLDGRDIATWDRLALARRLAYLPQERIVHWPLTVRTIVALGRYPHGAPAAAHTAADAAVEMALAAMDVTALAERSAGSLSGGELARVLIARALAQDAGVLLADEPAAGLDPAHGLVLFEHLVRLAAEGRSVVVALHDLSLAARFCHKLVLLKDGARLAAGEPGSVLTPQLMAEAFSIDARLERIDGLPVVIAKSARR